MLSNKRVAVQTDSKDTLGYPLGLICLPPTLLPPPPLRAAMMEPGAPDWADAMKTAFKKELDDMKQAQRAQDERITALEANNAQVKAETAQIKKDRADMYFKCIDMHEKRIDHLERRNETLYATRRNAFRQLLRVCDIHRVAGHFSYQGPWVEADDFEGIVSLVTKELSRVFVSIVRDLATMHEREELNDHRVAMLVYEMKLLRERFGPLSEHGRMIPIGYRADGAYTICNLHSELYPCRMCRG